MLRHTSSEVTQTTIKFKHEKETLLIHDLKPALNENIGSEKLHLY